MQQETDKKPRRRWGVKKEEDEESRQDGWDGMVGREDQKKNG